MEPPQSLTVEGVNYIPSDFLSSGIQKKTFKDNLSFGVTDERGEIPEFPGRHSELGIYHADTRHIDLWKVEINGRSPVALSQEVRSSGNILIVSMTNPDLPLLSGRKGKIPRDTFLIRRVLMLIEDQLAEYLVVRNFSAEPQNLELVFWAGSRFHDLFEVRGFTRDKRGKLLSPEEQRFPSESSDQNDPFRHCTSLSYRGVDEKLRQSWVTRFFDVEKIQLSPDRMGHFTHVSIEPKDEVVFRSLVSFEEPYPTSLERRQVGSASLSDMIQWASRHPSSTYVSAGVTIRTDNMVLDKAVRNARADIQMLLAHEGGGVMYPHAGIPWYSAPFGRDGIITAYQLLPWYPEIAKDVIEYVFSRLGTRHDPFTDEQPGKSFHEYRRGEMAALREVPFIPYYGTVDATPLSLILLRKYFAWTGDETHLSKWWEQATRAVGWLDSRIDEDSLGFVAYDKESPIGLANQGWKDSCDSIMHADGTLASSPIRLCEVQAYAYRAYRGMAALALHRKEEDFSRRCQESARKLKRGFYRHFWNEQEGYVHLALDGDGNPCRVKSSNMGHCLFGEILEHKDGERVSEHLMSRAMFSGFGIRTLSSDEGAYNPMSYHNGSVWPHDCTIVLEGFRRYGQKEALQRLASALIDVIESSPDLRLPELFCGFRKRSDDAPVPYDVACKPQAWAAGAVYQLIESLLGLDPMKTEQSRTDVIFPRQFGKVKVSGLRRCGEAFALEVQRHS